MNEKTAVKVVIKGRANREFRSLVEAGQSYVEEYYGDWIQANRIITIPTFPWISFNRVLHNVEKIPADAPKLSGDDAELEVSKKIFEFFDKRKEDCFLFTNIVCDFAKKDTHVSDVLRHFIENEDKLKKLQELSKKISKIEIDFIILCPRLGAVVGEVKATKELSNKLSDAISELNQAKTLIEIFVDHLPIHKLVCYPNSNLKESIPLKTKESLKRLEDQEIFLIDSSFNFNKILIEKIPEMQQTEEMKTEFQILLYWLIAMKTMVAATFKETTLQRISLNSKQIDQKQQAKETNRRIYEHDVFSAEQIKNKTVVKLQGTTQALYLKYLIKIKILFFQI